MDRASPDNVPARSAPVSRDGASSRAKDFNPPSQPWDVITSALLNELEQRLGSMRASWLAAEVSRLRALTNEASEDTSTNADRMHILRQLADFEPSLLSGEAEVAALIEKCESLIHRCSLASRGGRPSRDNLPRHRAA